MYAFLFQIMLLMAPNLIQGQVFTRILGPEENIYDYLPWYFSEKPGQKIVPYIDVQSVLSQDSIEGRQFQRLGIRRSLDWDKNQGTFYQFGNYHIWKLAARSQGAKTLGFKFTNLVLPQGSEMFVYNLDTRFLEGPIRSKDIHAGVFNSDYLNGDSLVIEVFLPTGTKDSFSIMVKDVIHGIVDFNPGIDKSFGQSLPCNVNTVCPVGAGWENEISAVCMIIIETGNCTGTLINSECSDLTPFILTANHCLLLSGIDPAEFVFRFNYESFSCSPSNEPGSKFWITFSGAQLRASSADSDFALLELNDPVVDFPSLSFAGWDRSANIPDNSTAIHHPNGDVKKITVDAQSPVIETNVITPSGIPPLAANMTFRIELEDGINGDFGALEGGSSGCPQFNQDHRIVGQLFGGNTPECDISYNKWFGRFFNSWDGGGTNDTRLSNWLGGNTNPITTNTILVPGISGDGVVCLTPETYTLDNPLPGYSVTWSVSPANLFGSPTAGNGVNAVLWAANSDAQGSATLIYTLTSQDCGSQQITKSIWVGKPIVTGIEGPECYTIASNVSITALAQGATEFTWSFPTCPNGTPKGDPDPACWFNYTGNSQQIFIYVGQQSGSISVWASNECGTSSINVPVNFCEGSPGPGPIIRSASSDEDAADLLPGKVVAYPNPANEILIIELSREFYPAAEPKDIELFDIAGSRLYRKAISGNSLQIDSSNFPPGVFYLKVHYRDDFTFRKIIIL